MVGWGDSLDSSRLRHLGGQSTSEGWSELEKYGLWDDTMAVSSTSLIYEADGVNHYANVHILKRNKRWWFKLGGGK